MSHQLPPFRSPVLKDGKEPPDQKVFSAPWERFISVLSSHLNSTVLDTDAASTTAPGIVELATAAEVRTGTSTTLVPSIDSYRQGSLVLGTLTATTSGTEKDFTIPSWAKRITVMFYNFSTNGTSVPIIRIGDSGGIETSGYLGGSGDAGVSINSTVGFPVLANQAAASISHGAIVLTLMDAATFLWVASGSTTKSDTTGSSATSGSKALTAALDTVRVTTVNGTDAFDAGSVNVLYE